MAQVTKIRTHKGNKYKVVTYNEQPFTQWVKDVRGNRVTVESRLGKTYSVMLSQNLIGANIQRGDMALVSPRKSGWIVLDVLRNDISIMGA